MNFPILPFYYYSSYNLVICITCQYASLSTTVPTQSSLFVDPVIQQGIRDLERAGQLAAWAPNLTDEKMPLDDPWVDYTGWDRRLRGHLNPKALDRLIAAVGPAG
ncbi:hypothetical protein F4811DRAFT_73381 [Daldinia bambusicola]|nr:hypothetical protein F4811DRAFT_73381 [Daldinia bambusicola]